MLCTWVGVRCDIRASGWSYKTEPIKQDEVVWLQEDFEGKYANCFRVGFNAFEIVIDFAQCRPNTTLAMLHTRIIVAPAYARTLLRLLAETISTYERNYESNLKQPET
jgi:hypothetical protein